MSSEQRAVLGRLPSVDRVVRRLADSPVARDVPHGLVVKAVRLEIASKRAEILAGRAANAEIDDSRVEARLRRMLRPLLLSVVNATGVVLHTNLGRSPLCDRAIDRLVEISRAYCNLEYDLGVGKRGDRYQHTSELLKQLTGAEAALVVNNNAAAVMLCLCGFATGTDVVVSRGELVEIGGSFRLPDVMELSGAHLREVGTTNCTHLRDYEDAIGDATSLLLKVHRSNFSLVGYSAEVDVQALADLGREHSIPTMLDLGSGTLMDVSDLELTEHSRPDKITVPQAVASGIDLVTFSGDKLLGGPQAGIVVGRQALIARLRSHPLMRTIRPGKLCLAALEATLETYRDERAYTEVPALALLLLPADEVKERAQKLGHVLRSRLKGGWVVNIVSVVSRVGGGALPDAAIPSWAVELVKDSGLIQDLSSALRTAETPVVARIEKGRLLFDLRTVLPSQLEALEYTIIEEATRLSCTN